MILKHKNLLNNRFTDQYISLIETALARGYSSRDEAKRGLGYVEKHHILPRSLDGDETSKNVVYLSGSEHIFTHKLLQNMFSDEVSSNLMLLAYWRMCNGKIGVDPLEYERVRMKFSVLQRQRMLGRVASIETKNKQSIAHRGNNRALGYKHTSIAKQKIRINTIKRRDSLKSITSKTYNIVFENGTTQIIKNLRNFAEENTLNYQILSHMASRGRKSAYSGIISCGRIDNV